MWAQPEMGSFSYLPPKGAQLQGGPGQQRVYVRTIKQPPGSGAAPSLGSPVEIIIHAADSVAGVSQRIAEVLGQASGSEVSAGVGPALRPSGVLLCLAHSGPRTHAQMGLPRIYLNGAELTDAARLERSVAQTPIPADSAPGARHPP
jgi:hypothetical protein